MSYRAHAGREDGMEMQDANLRRNHVRRNDVDTDAISSHDNTVVIVESTKQTMDEEISERYAHSSRESSILEPEGLRPVVRPTQLSRKLKERHANMFTFSLIVGSGLFLQNGRVIYLAGPGAAFLIYPAVALVIWGVMGALGEMTALFPVPGVIFELPARFLDESIGYATGWMAWFSWVVILASELAAVAGLFKFRFKPDYLQEVGYPESTLEWQTYDWNPAIWVTLFLILSLCINLLPIKLYGEVEYCVGVIKMCFCVVLILFQLIINIESGNGARYYRNPWNFLTQSYPSSTGGLPSTGSLAQLKGIWKGICTAIFALIGFETLAITAAESEEFDEQQRFASKEGLKISTRKTSIRIIFLYTLSTLMVSFNVPADDFYLIDSNAQSYGGGQNSAFVISAVRAGKRAWPGVMTGFFVFSTTSASINSLYLSSRLLHALALSRPVWPDYGFATDTKAWLEQVTRNGVPRNAVLASSLFGLLGYLACTPNHGQALGRMSTNSVISMLIVYVVICVTFLRFKSSLRKKLGSFHSDELGNTRGNARTFDREARSSYPYKSRGQPFRVIISGIVCTLVVVLNGWDTFRPFKLQDFISNYISVIVFILLWSAYRIRAMGQPDIKFWRLAPTNIMDRPTRVFRDPDNPGRDHLNLDIEHFWSVSNARKLKRWIWVWLE